MLLALKPVCSESLAFSFTVRGAVLCICFALL